MGGAWLWPQLCRQWALWSWESPLSSLGVFRFSRSFWAGPEVFHHSEASHVILMNLKALDHILTPSPHARRLDVPSTTREAL